MASRISSISQALAGNTSAMAIPKPRGAGDIVSQRHESTSWSPSAAATADVAGKRHVNAGLPTPPNSISPNLPPHSLKARSFREERNCAATADGAVGCPPAVIDSDIDLQDAVDHANSHGIRRHASVATASSFVSSVGTTAGHAGADSHGIITPLYLAKFHLPGIFGTSNGPIAIKDIMDQLGRSVPGFADITAAKARRIVVAALENRAGGGVNGDLEFEKVGWGKWDARPRGRQDQRDIYTIREGHMSPPASTAGSLAATAALRIPSSSKYLTARRRRRQSRGSSAQETAYSRSDSLAFSPGEHDADDMSIDEDEDIPIRYYAPRIASNPPQEEEFSDTDEEDWASIGAVGLRSTSYGSVGGILPVDFNVPRSRNPTPGSNVVSRSMPMNAGRPFSDRPAFRPLDFTGVEADSQEREAIEALMRMGSC